MNARLVLDADMTSATVADTGPGLAAVLSARGPDGRTVNEDGAMILVPSADRVVLAIADGAGGQAAGETAAHTALEVLRDEVVTAITAGENARTGVVRAFERANEAVQRAGNGAGTTLVVAAIHGRELRCFHVGDSVLLVTGQRGRVKLRTLSHSPVAYGVEAGLLDEEEAIHHDERHVLSSMLGMAEMRMEMNAVTTLARHDTVVLASDGLFDNIRVDEVIEIVRKGALDRASDRLYELASRRMRSPADGEPTKPDDLTFILYRATS